MERSRGTEASSVRVTGVDKRRCSTAANIDVRSENKSTAKIPTAD